ncbi:MAG: hypothetical protein GY868_08725 [Deltaproteobacteria bacterium]|nr:hypothetical protein [Deltaproteobacteria bacterium]
MKNKLFVTAVALFCAVLISGVSSVLAADGDILKRLERMEQEISDLRMENAELRTKVEGDKQQIRTENARLHDIVATDRKEIEELKKSAGKLGSGGLRAVLGKYDMQIYGRVKVDLQYDTGEMSGYGDLVGIVDAADHKNDSTNFNNRDTRFGVKVARRDGAWLSEARMEIDFYGSNSGNNLIPRMRLGYIKLTNDDWGASLLIGQDWIPVASLNPSMIEFGVMSGSGNLWWRVPQVTFRKNIGNFELLASAMKHRRISYEENDRMPWLLAKVSYKNGILGKGGLIALGGGWRNSRVGAGDFTWNDETNVNGRDNSVDRWLIALEIKLKIGKKLTFMAEPWIGQGLDKEFLRYRMGVNNNSSDASRRADTILSRGGWLSLTYAFNPKVNMSIGYGVDDPDSDDMDGMLSDGSYNNHQFTKNETYFINTWVAVTKAVKMGVEIQYHETERNGALRGTNNAVRYVFSTIYNF